MLEAGTHCCSPCRSDMQGQGEEAAVPMGEGPADMTSALGRGMHILPNHSVAVRECFFFFFTPISCQGFLLAGLRLRSQPFGTQNRAEEGRVNLGLGAQEKSCSWLIWESVPKEQSQKIHCGSFEVTGSLVSSCI